jgi:hypothetical protein
VQVLVQRPPARTRRATFAATGSPVIIPCCRGGLPCVDGVVAGLADHEGFTPFPGHEFCPRGLWSSRCGQVGKLVDLVDLDAGALVAEFAPYAAEPGDQLFAGGDRGW